MSTFPEIKKPLTQALEAIKAAEEAQGNPDLVISRLILALKALYTENQLAAVERNRLNDRITKLEKEVG